MRAKRVTPILNVSSIEESELRIMRPAITLLTCVLFAAVCQAQWQSARSPGIPRLADGKPDLNAAVPRASDGKPDLSGVWRRSADDTNSTTFLASGLGEIPLRPSARDLYNRRLAVDGAGRPAERCLPHGLPLEIGRASCRERV